MPIVSHLGAMSFVLGLAHKNRRLYNPKLFHGVDPMLYTLRGSLCEIISPDAGLRLAGTR